MRFSLNEATAAKRRFTFVCMQVDGVSPFIGATFAAGDLKFGKRFTEANTAGTVTEIANGLYRYEMSAGEVDTAGPITLRSTRTDIDPLALYREHEVV